MPVLSYASLSKLTWEEIELNLTRQLVHLEGALPPTVTVSEGSPTVCVHRPIRSKRTRGMYITAGTVGIVWLALGAADLTGELPTLNHTFWVWILQDL